MELKEMNGNHIEGKTFELDKTSSRIDLGMYLQKEVLNI
jgi:hypothetical protein